MSVAEDGAELTATSGTAASVATASTFSCAVGDMVVARVTRWDGGGGSSSAAYSCVSSAGSGAHLTFSLVTGTQKKLAGQESEIWIAWCSSTVTNDKVTASWTGNMEANQISVRKYSGSQDMTGLTAGTNYAASSANANSNHPLLTLSVKQTGSMLLACGVSFTGSAMTADAGDAIETQAAVGGGGQQWTEKQSATTSSTGNTNVGCTGPSDNWNISGIEIIPASASTRPVKMAGEWGGYAGVGGGFAG